MNAASPSASCWCRTSASNVTPNVRSTIASRSTAIASASRCWSISARFSSPVYPGETIRIDAWRLSASDIAFRGSVPQRDVVVLTPAQRLRLDVPAALAAARQVLTG